jgi:hypothetical protein
MISLNESGGGVPLYQIKMVAWSKPPIWRRVIVRADITLARLHQVIQLAMGWENAHLHRFIVGRIVYARSDAELGEDTLDEAEYTLADLALRARKKFIYDYDFGDGWNHELLVEKLLPPDTAFKHPVCIAGGMACPPEDFGGIPGYYEMLAALENPKHPYHEDRKEWIGGEWDAVAFDADEVNAALKHLKA